MVDLVAPADEAHFPSRRPAAETHDIRARHDFIRDPAFDEPTRRKKKKSLFRQSVFPEQFQVRAGTQVIQRLQKREATATGKSTKVPSP